MPTCLRAFFYISESCLPADTAPRMVADLVSHAQRKNAELGITGALLFTGNWFAQHIEGPGKNISALVSSLQQDVRHRNMIIVCDEPARQRRLSSWSLAYSGPSLYIERHVLNLLNSSGPTQQQHLAKMLRLMESFVKDLCDAPA